MHSVRIELAKLILVAGTRITYQATGDAVKGKCDAWFHFTCMLSPLLADECLGSGILPYIVEA